MEDEEGVVAEFEALLLEGVHYLVLKFLLVREDPADLLSKRANDNQETDELEVLKPDDKRIYEFLLFGLLLCVTVNVAEVKAPLFCCYADPDVPEEAGVVVAAASKD